MKIKGKIAKVGDCFYLRIPKPYIIDGNIKLGVDYEVDLIEMDKAVEQKTQEILMEQTRNANRTKEADFI